MTIQPLTQINGDCSRKSQKSSHPRVFNAPIEGFPLELDNMIISDGLKKLERLAG